MAEIIEQHALRDQLPALLASVAAGERFLIARDDQVIAEVRPITRPRPRLVARDEIRSAFLGVGPRLNRELARADLDAVLDQLI